MTALVYREPVIHYLFVGRCCFQFRAKMLLGYSRSHYTRFELQIPEIPALLIDNPISSFYLRTFRIILVSNTNGQKRNDRRLKQ